MSFGFTFSAPADRERAGNALERLTAQENCHMERDTDTARVHFCPGGDLFFRFEDTKFGTALYGDCCTSIAGPGFHAAAIAFVDALAREADLSLSVDDETGYYRDRDFARMRDEDFYQRLQMLTDICAVKAREEGLTNLCINWSPDQYRPAQVDGTVATPMGRFSLDRLSQWIQQAGVEPFAREFYIWNEPERDGLFYRNWALSLLWEQCSFMPGSRSQEDAAINKKIIELLEQAVSMDRSLPFPKAEYRLLCAMEGRSPADLSGVPSYESEYPIGYRRDTVVWDLGNLSVSIDGSFLFSYDDSSGNGDYVWFDGLDENWHTVRMTAFRGEGEAAFRPGTFAELFPEDFPVGEGLCRAAWAGVIEDEKESWEDVVAQVICGPQITFITVSYQHPEGREWAFDLLHSLSAHEGDG